MSDTAYRDRLTRIETYFDRTAVRAWEQMTSDAPLGRIRATVRAGRDRMRAEILAMLPADMTGLRLLDAGCGTGALSVEAAGRGAHVVGIDISPKLVALARDRAPEQLGERLDFRVGDLADPDLGGFDHVVSMDVLIHYPLAEATATLAALAGRTSRSMLFTFAPKTPALAAMHAVGQLFPRGDRSPAIQPVWEAAVRKHIADHPGLSAMTPGRTVRIKSGFYISQVLELVRATPSFTSPRGGEVDAASAAAGEGALRLESPAPPHPALRADLSPLGRGKDPRLGLIAQAPTGGEGARP